MYLSLNADDALSYECKNCHFAEPAMHDNKPSCILDKNYIDDETKYRQYINPNIKYDPTLPRVNAIKCVNPDCTKPDDQENEVIYVKYDRENLRFMYFCCFCEAFWKSK